MCGLSRFLAFVLIALSLSFSSVESGAKTLKVGFNSDWAPYSVGSAGSVEGILPDLIREILTKQMGVPVDVVGYPWARVQHLVETGEVDAFVSVPTTQRLQYALSSSESVYNVEMRTTVMRGSPVEKRLRDNHQPDALKALRYCDILGNGWGKAYAAQHGLKPIIVSKVINCLRMVQKGRADAVLQSRVVTDREIAAQNIGGDLVTLPTVYGKMTFTLLLSKKTAVGQGFVNRFDKTLRRMKADGSYAELISRLNRAPAD